MRVILSRKGFDSGAGGCPSPIVAGRPLSLPIPTKMPTQFRYGDISDELGEIVEQLTRGRFSKESFCHVDPDLDASMFSRLAGWRGALGQVAAAQGHLRNNAVGAGDLFLFWGLFRPAIRDAKWCFSGTAEHRIFGWLQIERVLSVGTDPGATLVQYPWLADHPHLLPGWPASNTVYIAPETLNFGSRELSCPGWGLFPSGLRLTAHGSHQPSLWNVPDWLNPMCGGCGMTYHPPGRWDRNGQLTVAARGQEFVADVGDRADALDWLQQLIEGAL